MENQLKFMVAFSSPKRSTPVVNVAARHALAVNAELVLCRIIPDAEKVGIVAQLIASDRPIEKARQQIELVVSALQAKGVNASGFAKVGEPGPALLKCALETGVHMMFIGTMSLLQRPAFYMARDPIVHYLVDNCPITLCLVRPDDPEAQSPLFQWQSPDE